MVLALVLARVLAGQAKKAMAAAKKIEGVKEASFVLGRWDMAILLEAPNQKAISAITAKINAIPSLRSSETLIEG
jgi:uncharacterized protein with GYD domain